MRDYDNRSLDQRVKDTIQEQLGIDKADVVEIASITDDLGADSLDCIELVMALEDDFGITISDEEAIQINTVGDCIALITEKVRVA